MSTIGYAQLTTTRESAEPGSSNDTTPGVKNYMDVLAALVPAEVLSLHALVLSATTESFVDGNNAAVRIIAGARRSIPIATCRTTRSAAPTPAAMPKPARSARALAARAA